jgi:hypothetical protein
VKVYEYVILVHPTAEEVKRGVIPRILAGPTAVLAKDDKGAAMLAGRAIPEEYVSVVDRIEVAVRPF